VLPADCLNVMQVLEQHLEEDQLERYAMGGEALGEGDDLLEEHLLGCPNCCEMLRDLEQEIAVIRLALRKIEYSKQ